MAPEDKIDAPHNATDLFLLLSLLLLILMHPVLVHDLLHKLMLAVLTFVPLIIAMIRLSREKILVWPFGFLTTTAVVCGTAAIIFNSHLFFIIQWVTLTVVFALAVAGLFSYLGRATTITAGHLYTAASIYLLLASLFYSLYGTIAAVSPGAFGKIASGPTDLPADLLYFSLITLTAVGYGDVVPRGGEVRMTAGLEAATGVMYVAITVAILVSGYRSPKR